MEIGNHFMTMIISRRGNNNWTRIIIISILFFFLTIVEGQREPRPRPPNDQLNHFCFANPALPPYVPFVPLGSLTGTLRVPQSDTTYGFLARWVADFKHYFPLLDIQTPIEGSGIASPCLIAKDCDFAVVAREMLLAEEQSYLNFYGRAALEFPVTGGSYNALAYTDAMTVFVNAANPLSEISYAEFDAIWSKDRKRGYPRAITKWGQLRELADYPEWADRDIELVGVDVANGFAHFLNRTILNGGRWVDGITSFPTVFPIATEVSARPYSFGYAGIAYLNATVKPLRIREQIEWPYLRSEGRGVLWTRQTVCDRTYPLNRLTYIYANKEPCQPISVALAEFLNYILSYEGQKAVEADAIFMPLGPEVVWELREHLHEARLSC